jgi:hypothetical protein
MCWKLERHIRLPTFHVFDEIDVLRHQNKIIACLGWGLILTKQSFYSAAVISDAEVLLCVCMHECTFVCRAYVRVCVNMCGCVCFLMRKWMCVCMYALVQYQCDILLSPVLRFSLPLISIISADCLSTPQCTTG